MKLLFLLLTTTFFSYGQELVVLKDNTKLEARKTKPRKNAFIITLLNGDKREIANKDVALIVNTRLEEEHFLKIEANINSVYFDGDTTYVKAKRIVVGKISIFEYYVRSMTPNGMGASNMSSARVLLCEKDNIINEVPMGGWLLGENYDRYTLLERLVHDNLSLKKEVINLDKKMKVSDFLQIIKRYNIDYFDSKKMGAVAPTGNSINAVLYTNEKLQSESYLLVNDSVKYSISNSTLANVKLVPSTTTKICLVQGDTRICDLIEASSYLSNYWKVSIESGYLELSREKKLDAQRDISLILSKQKK